MIRLITPLLITVLLASTLSAEIVTFTDKAAFQAAISGYSQISGTNFDTTTPGTIIADGDSVDGIKFNYDFGGVNLMVSDVFDTTSPDNFLGTDDADVIQDGDDFSLEFSLQNAIGMSFISADDMFDNDIRLTAGSTNVSLDADAVQDTLADGSKVFFLGILNTANKFSTASLSHPNYDGNGYFLYNVDDIVLATPEPSSAALLGISCLLLGSRRRRGGTG